MKNHNVWKKTADLMLGRGFYIALTLCVAAIGFSGYALYQAMNTVPEPPAPVRGNLEVEVPSPQLPVLPVQPDRPAPKPAPRPQPQAEAPAQEKQTAPRPVVYTWPAKGAVLREFSMETLALDPTLGDWRTHRGLDIAADLGTDVIAMGEGRVTGIYEEDLLGTVVVVEHPDGLASAYCGLGAEPPVRPGDLVQAGTVLGTVGDSGIGESGMEPHLHLETWLAGEPVDPTDYLPLR